MKLGLGDRNKREMEKRRKGEWGMGVGEIRGIFVNY